MGSFAFAHSAASEWQEAVEQCLAGLGTPPPGASLGFVYATDELAPHLDAVLDRVRERTGVPHWVGTVGVGICAGSQEYYEQPALALMVTDLPGDSFRVFAPLREAIEELDDGLDAWQHASGSHVALVHGDPRNPALPDLIEALAGRTAGGFLVGGLSSSRAHYGQIADEVTDGGLSGVMFAQDVPVLTGLTQGCTLIGSKHVVTRCQRNVAVELDGRPALEVFYEEIGEVLARDLNRIAGYIFVALPVPGSDTGDYLVRNLVGIDPAKGLLAVGDMLHTDDTLQFCRRDGSSAHTDLVRMLRGLKRRAPDGPPRGGVYFSCLGRGRNMFGADSEELRTIQRELGEFPLVGFFANGEISHDRLYGYTGVLVLFT